MADDTEQKNDKSEEIPAFRISPKKVDDSWKDEIRREREAAAAKAAPPAQKPVAATSPAEAARPAQAPASPEHAHEEEASMAASEPPQPAPSAQSKVEQQQSKIFMTFLGGLAQQALMQLGEIESPFSGQREVDLQGARYTVELLTVLQAKTKNNLNAEEAGALDETIHDLKTRYVEVTHELQRQMAAQAQKAIRPGPGGTIPGPGAGKRR